MPNNKNAITAQFEQFNLIATATDKAHYYKLTAQNLITGKFDSIIVFGELPKNSTRLVQEFGDIISVGICYYNQTFEEFCEFLYFDINTQVDEALDAYNDTARKTRFGFNVVGSYNTISDISEQIELLG